MISKKAVLLISFLSLHGLQQADMSGWKTLLGVVGAAYVADTAIRSGEKALQGEEMRKGVSSPINGVVRSESDENDQERGVIGVNIFGVECDVTYRKNVGWTAFVESLRVRGEVDGRKALMLLAAYAAGKKSGLC